MVKRLSTTRKFRASPAALWIATKSCRGRSTSKAARPDTWLTGTSSSRQSGRESWIRTKPNSITFFLHDILRQPRELQRAFDYLQSEDRPPRQRWRHFDAIDLSTTPRTLPEIDASMVLVDRNHGQPVCNGGLLDL